MADENTLRSHRANDAYGDDSIPSGKRDHAGGHDPLAELARLIGQSDSFADIGRGNPRASEGRDPSHFAVGAPPSAGGWRRDPPPSYDAPVQPEYGADYESDPRRSHFPPATTPRHQRVAVAADPYADPHDQVQFQDRPYQDRPYDDDRFEQAEAGTAYGAAEPEHNAYYDDEAPMGPQDEEMYDDPPPSTRGRSGLLTVVTLVGCAMLGTAGAYGYRTYYVGGAPANPPIIVADKTPAKVVPPTDAQSSKAIQDRVGNQGGNERMVSHEEQPMELPASGTQSVPRVVLPAPVAPMPNSSAVFPPPPPMQSATPARSDASPAQRSAAGGEPKRIRTVTIRPEGTDEAGKPVGGIDPSGSAPAPRVAAAPSRNGPLSLNPASEEAPAPVRAAPAPRSASRLASASAGGAGGYMVQISSQRSEADAHASYRAMQAKYHSVLGGHEGIVRRADLGAKGTYYRAMVGPFASAGEAGQLCTQLKAAGGQCIIHRN